MKLRSVVLASLMVLLSSSVFAKDLVSFACTQDTKVMGISLDVADNASIATMTGIVKAFEKTAASMSAEDLASFKGWQAFRAALSDEEFNALNSVTRPQVVDSLTCADLKEVK